MTDHEKTVAICTKYGFSYPHAFMLLRQHGFDYDSLVDYLEDMGV